MQLQKNFFINFFFHAHARTGMSASWRLGEITLFNTAEVKKRLLKSGIARETILENSPGTTPHPTSCPY